MPRQNKQRPLIFCQGDKKELEEITGEKFEYLPILKQLIKRPLESREIFPDDYIDLAFEEYTCNSINEVTKRFLYLASTEGADAVIHFQIIVQPATKSLPSSEKPLYIGTGTFLRRKIGPDNPSS